MLKLSLLLTVAIASLAQSQTIYLPPQYEYGSGIDRYYYGGSDPRIFARAERDMAARRLSGVADSLPMVYSDALPTHPNAYYYGVTASDARDQAYNAMPRYFRMRDLVGHVEADGSVTVPASGAGETVIKPYAKPAATTRKSGVIIIIPKAKPMTPVASAQ
jgi:hypothetical protein